MPEVAVITESTLICPVCGTAKVETMPTDACQYFYECTGCATLLRPNPGDCCVFCSYGSVPCPPIQAADGNPLCCQSGGDRVTAEIRPGIQPPGWDQMTNAMQLDWDAVRYRVSGMDCPSCAAKIEGAARKLPGIGAVHMSIASQEMVLSVDDAARRMPELERTIEGLGYRLARLDAPGDADSEIPDLTHVTPAYKRALWIVVLLNAAYGLIEIVGGFLAGSQALKADALDFVGDGAISFLGLIAVAWGVAARAKAALLQGAFLGALGVAVMAMTLYRVFVLNVPEAGLMGGFGVVALAVNIACALVLIPHRKGDANVRAVWLFSRNDAIGNAAVVAAAGLVAWTGTQWPDLAVAVVTAALFLHSAWAIINDARRDLSRGS